MERPAKPEPDIKEDSASAEVPQKKEEQPEQREAKAEPQEPPPAPVPRVANSSDYIEPAFNIRMLRKRLEDASTPVSEIKRLLMGALQDVASTTFRDDQVPQAWTFS